MWKKRSHLFYAQLLLTVLVCIYLIVPVIQSIIAGLTVNFIKGVGSGLTLRWFVMVWELYSDAIFRSIFIGLACVAITLVISVPIAYVIVKKQNRLTRLFEDFLLMPMAVPGVVIAMALIMSYGMFREFRMSALIILAGHVVFTLPVMVRSIIAVMHSINLKDLEESAASLGARFWNRFFRIVVPNAMPGILAGSLMVLTLSMGEFNLSWLLATPVTQTLPVSLADSYVALRIEIGSAYTVIFFLSVIPLLMVIQWQARPRKKEFPVEETNQLHKEIPDSPEKKTVAFPTYRDPDNKRSTVSGIRIRLVNCAKTFKGGVKALESTNLMVEAGETVAVLGPSGCGKTTMLRILAGLESPDPGGRVFFGDEDVTEVPTEKRNVGMVFQSYALFPNMNVADNIAYGLKARGDDAAARKKRVNEMLDMMRIGDLRNRRIDQLSGGQKQRVALARAIAVRSRVLLMDEPLTALDARLRDSLRVEIDSLLRSLGTTTIYVTHDRGEAMALGDRIVVMDIGKVDQIGSPREIYYEPKNYFVANCVGTVNRLRCLVRQGNLIFPCNSIPLESIPGVRARENEEVDIFFRPEHVTVVDAGQGDFTGTVAASFFMGDRTSLIVKDSSMGDITIETAGRQSFVNGQQVGIRIDPSALRILS